LDLAFARAVSDLIAILLGTIVGGLAAKGGGECACKTSVGRSRRRERV